MKSDHKKISLNYALLPILVLIALLAFNVYMYGDNALAGSNQFILLVGAAAAMLVGFKHKIPYKKMMESVADNLKSTSSAILILLFVGSLSGTWLISGVIPAMIYYGLDILHPTIFLAASVVIAAIISVATGSSWTTSATVGIALIGIGKAIGLNEGMIAGAVISGAYFGDKLSPMSDTTNLAAAMAGTDLFTHIRYMAFTTVPSVIITLIVFFVLGFAAEVQPISDTSSMQAAISQSFNITPWLLLVPLVVIVLIIRKTKPLVALFIGTMLGGVFAMIFQPQIIWNNGAKYSIETSIPEAYQHDFDTDFTAYNYMPAGDYTLKSNNETIKSQLSFSLPEAKGKQPIPFKRSAGIYKNQKKVGEVAVVAKPTNFWQSAYFAIMNAISVDSAVQTNNQNLNDLFESSGMYGMLGTIWLIVCAMVFGGVLEAIGALERITQFFLGIAKSVFGLYASVVATCLGLNFSASDQYLAIVVPGKMFKKAFDKKGLAPENLSRTLEDSGTVTSVLVPWNTCGAYQAGVLGVDTSSYFIYAVFNYVSPFMTLLFVALKIRIKMIGGGYLK